MTAFVNKNVHVFLETKNGRCGPLHGRVISMHEEVLRIRCDVPNDEDTRGVLGDVRDGVLGGSMEFTAPGVSDVVQNGGITITVLDPTEPESFDEEATPAETPPPA